MSSIYNEESNKLLRILSPAAYAKISDHLIPIFLPHSYKIATPRTVYTDIVFPDSGIISVVNVTKGIWQEVGLFGNEGAAGMSSILSASLTRNLVVVQVPGAGHQISSKILKAVFDNDEEVRELLLSYVETFISQLTHTAMANVQCNAVQRLARWLIMIDDRSASHDLPLTHDYIAAMLGVARSSVTISLHALEATGAISTGRKLVSINSRPQLLELVGEFYGKPEKDYEDIMAARSYANRNRDPSPN